MKKNYLSLCIMTLKHEKIVDVLIRATIVDATKYFHNFSR
jgi:hypothetical protein